MERYGYHPITRILFYTIAGVVLGLLLATIYVQEQGKSIFESGIFIFNTESQNRSVNRSIDQSIAFGQKLESASIDRLSISNRTIDSKPAMPLILIWTPYFGVPWQLALHWFDNCPSELRCSATTDRRQIDNSSAIIFHMRDFSWTAIPRQSIRRIDQYYVFALWESPPYAGIELSTSEKMSFFNLTMTYRLDSDIYYPYAFFEKLPLSQDNTTNSTSNSFNSEDLIRVSESKTSLIAWFVSHCETYGRRERFVADLRRYVDVDIYGSCGTKSCPRERTGVGVGIADANKCEQILTQRYKFYLSLENALCKDYVTEKLYNVLDNSIIVPVVLERKILLDTSLDRETRTVLNNSVIAVDDFATVTQLVAYLNYLDKNLTAYLQYFRWRQTHRVVLDDSRFGVGCELCRIVKEKKERKIQNIHQWYHQEARCHSYQ